MEFSAIYARPSAVKEITRAKGGGYGNMRQSSLSPHQNAVIQAPVAHYLDNGITNWEEGITSVQRL